MPADQLTWLFREIQIYFTHTKSLLPNSPEGNLWLELETSRRVHQDWVTEVREINPALLAYHVLLNTADTEDLEAPDLRCETMPELEAAQRPNSWTEPGVIFKLRNVFINPPVLKLSCHLSPLSSGHFTEGLSGLLLSNVEDDISSWLSSLSRFAHSRLQSSTQHRDRTKWTSHEIFFLHHHILAVPEAGGVQEAGGVKEAGVPEAVWGKSPSKEGCPGASRTPLSSTSPPWACQTELAWVAEDEDQVLHLHGSLQSG